MSINLQGKSAIVTGSTRGIGLAIAEMLLRQGCNVAISSRYDRDVQVTIEKLSRSGEGKVIGLAADVRNPSAVKSLVERTVNQFNGIDILVNNAGVGIFGRVDELKVEDFQAVIETNLLGVIYCCHYAIPHMKNGGYIFNISSLAAINAHPKMSIYNASKFGLNGFSEALMQEVRHDGIKVSQILPGSVNTHFGGDTPGEQNSWQLQPSDIAELVYDLLSHDKRCLPSKIEVRPGRPPKK
jgi:3-oxoacyl-[acyl-carrier protein] reductase